MPLPNDGEVVCQATLRQKHVTPKRVASKSDVHSLAVKVKLVGISQAVLPYQEAKQTIREMLHSG